MNTQSLHLRLDEAIGWLNQRADRQGVYNHPSLQHIRMRLEAISYPASQLISYNKASQILNEFESDKLAGQIDKVIRATRDDFRRAKFHTTMPWMPHA